MIRIAILVLGSAAAIARVLFPPMVLRLGEGRVLPCGDISQPCVPDTATIALHLVVIAAVTVAAIVIARLAEQARAANASADGGGDGGPSRGTPEHVAVTVRVHHEPHRVSSFDVNLTDEGVIDAEHLAHRLRTCGGMSALVRAVCLVSEGDRREQWVMDADTDESLGVLEVATGAGA
jgi:hypothetical protein